MKTLLSTTIVLILLVSRSNSQKATVAAEDLFFDKGKIENGLYTNYCSGVSLPIPGGWKLSQIPGLQEGKAVRLPGQLGLLILDRPTGKLFGDRIAFNDVDASKTALSVERFVSGSAQRQIEADPQRRKLIHDALPVTYAKRLFYRADYQHSFSNEQTQFESFVYTEYRRHFVGFTLIAGSQEVLDEAAGLLTKLSLADKEPDPRCTMGPNDGALGGVIGGIVSSKPGSGVASRVIVSELVGLGLIIERVEPDYPEQARQEHIQGDVLLKVVVDANGVVEDASLVSGPPLLAPAAIAAVKKWKFKPYVLNGQAVKIETRLRVPFIL